MIRGITGNVHVILILFVLLCFVTGTFLETASQVLIYTPLFLPTLKGLGVSPLHFGILLTVGTMLGMMTPPVGINLFVAQGISGAKISKMTKAILPFLFVMLFVQILFVFFPGFSTFLPGLFSK